MKKLILPLLIALLFGTAAACDPNQGKPGNSGVDNTPKDCFSDTGSSKPVFLTITMGGGKPPWQATGHARVVATGQSVSFDEPITQDGGFTRKLMYISGCKVEVRAEVKNNKPDFAFVRIDDTATNKCREESQSAFRLACTVTTEQ